VLLTPFLYVTDSLEHAGLAIAQEQLFNLNDGGMRLVLRHGHGVNLFENVVRTLVA